MENRSRYFLLPSQIVLWEGTESKWLPVPGSSRRWGGGGGRRHFPCPVAGLILGDFLTFSLLSSSPTKEVCTLVLWCSLTFPPHQQKQWWQARFGGLLGFSFAFLFLTPSPTYLYLCFFLLPTTIVCIAALSQKKQQHGFLTR